MKGFISVTQTNNQGSYINVKYIVRIDKAVKGCVIFLVGGEKIDVKQEFDVIEKLINNTISL